MEKTETLSSNIKKETRVSTFSTVLQYSAEIPSQGNKTSKRHDERDLNREGRSQIIPICR
jgi:hypothetical protein